MGEEGQVISCHTVDAWNQQLQNGKNKLVLIMIHFFCQSHTLIVC